MRARYRFVKPPQVLRRVRCDNLALVPGNLLPDRNVWQQVANSLPAGAVLVVLPKDNAPQKQALLAVAKQLAASGHQVSVRAEADFARAGN